MNIEKLADGLDLPPKRDLAKDVHILLPRRRQHLRDVLDKLEVEQTLKKIYPSLDITYAYNPVKGYAVKTSGPLEHNITGFFILPVGLEIFDTLSSEAYNPENESIEEATTRRFGVRGTILNPNARLSLIDLTIGYLDIPNAQVKRKYEPKSVIQQRSLIKEILTRLHPSLS